ncbi:transcription initiation factor TFIID subunit 4 isoform X2 [Electrophorus electricus]|uniref:transcription initiation factor TFIID subunit 4 isoform X2 n=1 Tax=Electrophorus electricus TaxID=8005 RepID=UPI0015CFA243|nr:transcription initiation factor TFIID subunit 4 isoform X2 [Electrophorus electricus]
MMSSRFPQCICCKTTQAYNTFRECLPKMAGVPDPLEDMLYSEVDEKAVSDLVGSLESQLGGQNKLAASQSEVRRSGSSETVNNNLGKLLPAQVGTTLEQRQSGLHKVEQMQEVSTQENVSEGTPTSNSMPSSLSTPGSVAIATNRVQSHATANTTLVPKPAPGPVTSPNCSSDAAVVTLAPSSLPTDTLPNTNHISSAVRTVSSRALSSGNGNSGTVTVNSPAVASATAAQAGFQTEATSVNGGVTGSGLGSDNGNMIVPNGTSGTFVSSQPNHILPQATNLSSSQTTPAVALQRPPNVVPNGSDPEVAALPAQGVSAAPGPASTVVFSNTNASLVKGNPQTQIKTIVPNQLPGNHVGLHPSPSTPVFTPAGSMQSNAVGASLSVSSNPTVLVKPDACVAGQATSLLRPGAPSTVAVTAGVAQGHGVPASPRPVIPQLAVRPQQTTIQLPPGFTIPQGMVLVRTEAGQLVLVPQQVLAQAKAQNQNKANLSPRPATPSTGATFRVTTPVSQSPVTSQPIRPISPAQVKVVQAAGVASPALQTPVVTVSSAQQHTANTTVITAGNRLQGPPQTLMKPLSTPPTATVTMTGASGFSQEMQENVKKCKNFLATLIKLASHNSPSPDTSRNVKALVQDLLDAKIEPEEFTSRLQTELKSSPQPYLVPFLKKSLPALRLTLLNSQQSLVQLGQAPASSTPLTGSTIKAPPPRALSTAVPTVRTTITQDPTATVAIKRSGAQASPTRMPMVITQAIRPQGSVVRGAAVQLRGPVPITMQASSNQKQKLNDPGGGTFRDDDDINDVASMAGVNLNEENARILATGSELVGTQIRSCKDDTLLPAGPLHRRILEIARKLGVNEVAGDVVSLVSHATEARLRTMLENVSALAQHRADGCREEGVREQTSDVRAQLKFFEQLEKLEKQRKDEEEREILLRAAKSRSRQEDPEQARLKQKAKEMQQQELAQMRQRDANLTALAAIGPRKKRKLESPGPPASAGEASGSSSGPLGATSAPRQARRITRVTLRDLIFCLEQERTTARSLLLYKALLK